MKYNMIVILVLFLFLFSSNSNEIIVGKCPDIREQMLTAAKKQFELFPDGKNAELTRFAYIGTVKTTNSNYYVVDMKYVLTGMSAPRGNNLILFFNHNIKFIGYQQYSYLNPPLFCEDSKVYLFGIEECFGPGEGNAWELKDGFDKRRLIKKRKIGSYY